MHFEYSKGPEEQFSLFGEVSPDMLRVSFYQDEETAARRVPRKHNEAPAPMEMDPLFDMDVLMSEFSDTLFSTLASHQPIAWPNPREIGKKIISCHNYIGSIFSIFDLKDVCAGCTVMASSSVVADCNQLNTSNLSLH